MVCEAIQIAEWFGQFERERAGMNERRSKFAIGGEIFEFQMHSWSEVKCHLMLILNIGQSYFRFIFRSRRRHGFSSDSDGYVFCLAT